MLSDGELAEIMERVERYVHFGGLPPTTDDMHLMVGEVVNRRAQVADLIAQRRQDRDKIIHLRELLAAVGQATR
jgi:hypothetical protein